MSNKIGDCMGKYCWKIRLKNGRTISDTDWNLLSYEQSKNGLLIFKKAIECIEIEEVKKGIWPFRKTEKVEVEKIKYVTKDIFNISEIVRCTFGDLFQSI
jgi:hypothetical protein